APPSLRGRQRVVWRRFRRGCRAGTCRHGGAPTGGGGNAASGAERFAGRAHGDGGGGTNRAVHLKTDDRGRITDDRRRTGEFRYLSSSSVVSPPPFCSVSRDQPVEQFRIDI